MEWASSSKALSNLSFADLSQVSGQSGIIHCVAAASHEPVAPRSFTPTPRRERGSHELRVSPRLRSTRSNPAKSAARVPRGSVPPAVPTRVGGIKRGPPGASSHLPFQGAESPPVHLPSLSQVSVQVHHHRRHRCASEPDTRPSPDVRGASSASTTFSCLPRNAPRAAQTVC